MINDYKYLNKEIISTINNLSLRAKFVVEGFIVGLHKSPYHGFSAEFSDHRHYGQGDEIKHIDWKLWAKTDRYYVKQYEEETNLRAQIIIDQSKSMEFNSINISKLDYAKNLCASLSYLMLKQQDAVGLSIFDSKIRAFIRPNSKSSHLNKLLLQLSKISPGPETDIASILHQSADTIKKRGLIILISDLLDDAEKIIAGLKHFKYKGHEVIIFHILDPQEINLKYQNRVKFIDMETNQSIETEPLHIEKVYKDKINSHCSELKYACGQNKIDYVQLLTNQQLDIALTEYLKKRNKFGG